MRSRRTDSRWYITYKQIKRQQNKKALLCSENAGRRRKKSHEKTKTMVETEHTENE